MFVRTMACRSLRVLAKCGPEAAKWSETFTGLVSENLPKVLDVVYHTDGVTPIFLNDCTKYRTSNSFKHYVKKFPAKCYMYVCLYVLLI